MYVLTLPVLRKMLHTAAVDLKDNVQYLCELDSVAGDGDHGIAIGHIADILKSHSDDTTIATMNLLLEGIGDAFMGVNAGSSGPLWGTIFAGMADGIDDQQELTEIEFKRMFAQAKEDFMDVSKAKVGDKTLVDAFYPAVSAIAETEGSIEALLDAAAEAAKKGADATADMTAKFGRAKNVGERSLGHKDPGLPFPPCLRRGTSPPPRQLPIRPSPRCGRCSSASVRARSAKCAR